MNPLPKTIIAENPRRIAVGLTLPQRLLGAVPGAPVAESSQPLKQFSTVQLTLLNGVPNVQDIQGDYVFIQACDQLLGIPTGAGIAPNTTYVTLKDSNGNLFSLDCVGKAVRMPTPFTKLEITMVSVANAGGIGAFPAINIVLAIGYGRVQNDGGVRSAVGLGDLVQSQAFLRPNNATPYAANQIVSDNNFGKFVFYSISRFPLGSAIITKARLKKSGPNIVNADFTLYLFKSTNVPFSAVDQAAWSPQFGTARTIVGVIRFPAFITGDGASTYAACDLDGISVPVTTDATISVPGVVLNGVIPPALPFGVLTLGGSLVGVLVCNGAYTPSLGETFQVDLFVDRY